MDVTNLESSRNQTDSRSRVRLETDFSRWRIGLHCVSDSLAYITYLRHPQSILLIFMNPEHGVIRSPRISQNGYVLA
jgi:hypothetical protein